MKKSLNKANILQTNEQIMSIHIYWSKSAPCLSLFPFLLIIFSSFVFNTGCAMLADYVISVKLQVSYLRAHGELNAYKLQRSCQTKIYIPQQLHNIALLASNCSQLIAVPQDRISQKMV